MESEFYPPKLDRLCKWFQTMAIQGEEMAKENLHAAESEMNCLGEWLEFSPDDQVLALLPLASSPFRFSGSYTVAIKCPT